MKLRICPLCSKEFRVCERDYKKNWRLYCSASCKRMHSHIYMTCNYCEEIFWLYRSKYKQGRGKYCCRECYAEGSAQNWFEKREKL